MGGFVGFIDKFEEDKKLEMVRAMTSRIIHRGPDGEGYYTDRDIALGFRRLNIIDIESGNQPMRYENLTMTFDGVIYNYMEIREELIKKGYTFNTSCDAETVLLGYKEYGDAILPKLRGMFAFVIWDADNRRLFGARDIFGVKPFYYGIYDKLFVFGSEIKSFIPHPDFKCEVNGSVLKNYLVFQYSPTNDTFFAGVKKLPPSTSFVYDVTANSFTVKKYYEFKYNIENKPFDEMKKKLKEVLEESIKCHQISDVEIGSFLSGGVDSSFIAAAVKPSKTFSVGFSKVFDESVHAKALSDMLGIENKCEIITGDDFFAALPSVQYHSDEPHANLSAVPLYFLSKLASKELKVVLSGEGPDELFGGYLSYIENGFEKAYKKIPFGLRKSIGNSAKKRSHFKGRELFIRTGEKIEDRYIGQAFIMDDSEANGILKNEYKSSVKFKDITAPFYEKVAGECDLTKKMYLDMNIWIPGDILLKADKMTMAHSLEVRAPFLDKLVWEQSAVIPVKYKVKGRKTKYIFRKVSEEYVPQEWAKRKKLGFPVPFTAWIREEKYYNMVREIFSDSDADIFFEKDKLLEMLEEHYQNTKNNGRKIYTVLAFLIWYKQYFGK